MHRAAGVEVPSDGFDRDLGFWLHDGGTTRGCCSRVRAGCGVRQHRQWIGNVMTVIQYHLKLSNVFILARDQFNDLGAPGLSECSARQVFLTVETYKKY
jgi:hypothetical protein